MQDLIEKLTNNANITPAQASIVLDTVKDYVKEQFPMMASAVDKLFSANEKPKEDDYLA